MTKIKVPARIKQSQLGTLTQYFPGYAANKAIAICNTGNTIILETWDGQGYWVKYVYKDYSSSYLHFRKAKKDSIGNYTL
jgi:hypothetical protein